jgi:hypothetical protein
MSNRVLSEIEKPCLDYLLWMATSQLPRSLMQGTKGMKVAGETFLTKNPLETQKAYDARLEQSTLLNAYRKTCTFLAGQVFQSDVIFSDEVSEELKTEAKDIDGKGNSIHVFAKRLFINGIAKGVAHILIDYPSTKGEVLTKEQEQARNIRPFFREVKPEDIIGYRFTDDGLLENIRIRETGVIADGLYGVVLRDRIRIYFNDGRWELHERRDDIGFVLIEQGSLSYKGIPLVSFIPGDETSIISGETPLMDLAELNLRHWRSSSDQINILHIGRVAILFGRNVEVSKLPVGPSVLISSSEDNSDLKYVEISGAAIGAGASDLKEIENKMALYGLQQLIPRSGNMTATEKAITSGESQSSLGTWATEFETALQNAFTIAEEFRNGTFPEDGVKVNKEYNFGIANDAELTVLNNSTFLSEQVKFNEFKRRGIIDENTTWQDNQDQKTEEVRNSTPTTNLAGTLFGNTGV